MSRRRVAPGVAKGTMKGEKRILENRLRLSGDNKESRPLPDKHIGRLLAKATVHIINIIRLVVTLTDLFTSF